MRTRPFVVLVALLALGFAAPSQARYHGRHGGIRIGVSVGWNPWWWGPGWYGAGWWGPGWYGPGYAPGPYASRVAARPDVAAVDTDVEPEHARVFLNGELIGSADDFDGYPSYLYLRPGHYTIDFKLGGYRSETLDIDAKAGRYFPVDLKLQRIASEPATPWYDRPSSPAAGTIFGPPRAAAAVEAPKSGPDPGLRKELRQPPSVPRAGELARRGAALDLRVTPENASVYLDGEFLGTGAELGRLERGVAVTPGTHHLDVVAPGHAAKSLELSVEAGARQQVVVQLDQPSGSE